MTAIRTYGVIWLFAAAVTGVSYAAGLITALTFPIFGFAIATLAVAGFVVVLPIWLNEHFEPRTYPVVRKR